MNKSNSNFDARVRFSLRWKITLPFIFLALILGFGAAYLVNQLLNQTEEIQFLRQLADSGKQTSDGVVRVEEDMLEVVRLIANTEGVAQSIGLQNSEDLRARVLPLVINSALNFAVILDQEAISLLTIRHRLQGGAADYAVLKGETFYREWDFVQQLLNGENDAIGDKWVGLESIVVDDSEASVFLIGGPLRDNQGNVIGAVLVGTYADSLVEQLGLGAGANVGIYDAQTGQLLGSSLEPANADSLTLSDVELSSALMPAGTQTFVRNISVSGSPYTEVLIKFQARQNTLDLGVFGISLLHSQGQDVLLDNVLTVARYGIVALILVVSIGLLISNMITRPLVEIAKASVQVAAGNLDTFVSERSNDEIGVLARSFNRLVAGLRESLPYRDAVVPVLDPQVREDFQEYVADQDITLDGISAEATILAADLSSFTGGVDFSEPEEIVASLNKYYEAMLPTVAQHGGVISKFDGDSMITFFGVLPKRTPAQMSALQGVHAGLELLRLVDQWNTQRAVQGVPALEMWIGITTGVVVAGGIGNKSHLQLGVIGDTVLEARDVQEICRELGAGALLISEKTYSLLENAHDQFKFGRYGRAKLRHSARNVTIYEVKGRRTRLIKRGRRQGVN
ncbi:MAG: HAMP domain-containing protein [Chloroflexi bacterium]|nr:HAMP domain-containing protein [Chloroflexota bacterium]